MVIEAVILAAGKGTRLGKIVDDIPKPMLQIDSRPLLEINLNKLLDRKVTNIYVNSFYKGDIIKNYISSNYKDSVKCIVEKELLGTAGTIKSIMNRFESDNLLIMHGDNFFEDDLRELIIEFQNLPENIWGVVGVFSIDNPELYGTFELDDNNIIKKFIEKDKNSKSRIANSAVYIFKGEALKLFLELDSSENDISLHILPKLIGRLKAVPLQGYFIDIGTPKNLRKARELAMRKVY